jgi:hypothetical protein
MSDTLLAPPPPVEPAAVPAAVAEPANTSADPSIRQRARRNRALAIAFVVAVIGAVIIALAPHARTGDLDPRSYDPTGSHAVAALLDERGVQTHTVTTLADAKVQAVAGTTLVVAHPERLAADDLHQLAATRADLVVIGAETDEIQALGFPLAWAPAASGNARTPQCELPAATVAGAAEFSFSGYTINGSWVGCYPAEDSDGLVTSTTGGRTITLVGSGLFLQNSNIDRQGNAALTLGLLDAHADVVWLVPDAIAPASTSADRVGVSDLLPDRLQWAIVQLLVAVIVIALWRGRRFGRLVYEELPVVVRQSETVLGRARLYRRSRSLGRAADALRAGARDRLGQRLGLGVRPEQPALVQAVAGRSVQPPAAVESLLYGSTPVDDHALVTLAHALTALEQEVLRS